MKAVVLVGGEGTRLRPLTFSIPKPLLPIANQAHLERQLAWLAAHGVDEVVLSMGYLPDAFHAHFGDGSGRDTFGDVTLRYAVEDEPLGTAGAIRLAAEEIDERFIVCNGDVLTALDLGAMVRFHDERGAEATISLTQVEDPSAFGVVPTRDDGQVIAFVEKPAPEKAPSNWINAGTYVLEPSFCDRIPPRLNVSVERETFPRMLQQPGLLYGYQSDEYWIDIGTPEKYVQVHHDIMDGRFVAPPFAGLTGPRRCIAPDVRIEDGATIEDPVFIDEGVLVKAGARLGPYAVLGRQTQVEEEAIIERAIVWPNCRIGSQSSIADAVLGRQCHIGRNVSLNSGAVLGDKTTLTDFTKA